uniref:(R)-specific enoyl-CoA hydratase n=1 Tax=uncultured bacterium 20 TaxID=1748270 RepID=A0A0U3JBN0_9BACT|nr:(R)-specific enoyl-CoA hydratase [uncultured bacterium 20]
MTEEAYSVRTIPQFAGRELGVSDWLRIDQERIDRFAACTDDRQWIHVDVERAERESPFGTTVAHGLLVLSLLPRFGFEVGLVPPGVSSALNYGFDGVRFVSPVKAGARVRDRVTLLEATDKGEGRLLVKARHTIEIEGESKPALVAEMLAMLITG